MKFAAVGQGNLTVTPIQIARAFGALLNDGILPALRLVDAIEDPEGGWDRVPSQDTPYAVITPEVAQLVLSTSRNFGEDIRGFSFQAIVGPERARLHWFLGMDRDDIAIVVVLEGESLEIAEAMGISILNNR